MSYTRVLPPEMNLQDSISAGDFRNDSNFAVPLGQRYDDGEGREFVFMELNSDSASTGAVVGVGSAADFLADPGKSTALTEKVKGVVVADHEVAEGDGCFIQIAGKGLVNLQTDSNVSDGDFLEKDSDNADVARPGSSVAIFGRAHTADSSSLLPAGQYDIRLR